MSQWGIEQWGNDPWGEATLIDLGPFTDVGGNELALPAQIDFVGFTPDDTIAGRNIIYEMHVKSLRDADAASGFLWRRYCEGPEIIRKRLEARIDELVTLYNIASIEDRFLQYLLPQVGWTSSYAPILDKLDANTIRRLIASSAALWKTRGTNGAYIEILNAIIGVDAWEWNWHDRRFVLGATRLGQDESPGSGWTDLRFTNVDSRRTTNLRIADAERAIDRELVSEIVKAWRPSGERVQITYVEFWDRFANDTKPWQSYDSESPSATTISDGTLKLLNSGITQHTFVESEALLLLESYMTRARIKNSLATGYHGLALGFAGDFSQHIEIRLYPADSTLAVYQNAVELVSVDILHDRGILLMPDAWYTLRVVASNGSLAVYLDNSKILEFAIELAPGTSGVVHGVDSDLEVDHFEILPIPGENVLISINPQ